MNTRRVSIRDGGGGGDVTVTVTASLKAWIRLIQGGRRASQISKALLVCSCFSLEVKMPTWVPRYAGRYAAHERDGVVLSPSA